MRENEEKDILNDSEKSGPFSQNSLNENLIEVNQAEVVQVRKPGFCDNCFYTIFPCFRHVDTNRRRKVFLRDIQNNVTEWSNKEENNKYSILFFLPVVLFNQFRQFGNFFYLIMTITQFFDALKVGFLFTYLSPLLMVVIFSMLKELYDDIKRRIQDKITNSTKVTVLIKNGKGNNAVKTNKAAADLEIGDIIVLTKIQEFLQIL